MQLALDPIWLSPPSHDDTPHWLSRIRSLLDLIAADQVSISCPKALRGVMVARWFEEGSHSDLVRTLGEIEGRLQAEVELTEGPALLDLVSCEPSYIWSGLAADERRLFLEHLSEAALAKRDGDCHLGVLSPGENWTEPSVTVKLEAAVLAREDRQGIDLEIGGEETTLREFLDRSEEFADVLRACSRRPCELIRAPQFGLRTYFIGALDGSPGEIDYEIGPGFAASACRFGLDRVEARARTCLRTMALIASGDAERVESHEERDGSGANNKIVRDAAGNPVIRSYINNRTPNALRLFWVRQERPLFLNVSGHRGKPAI